MGWIETLCSLQTGQEKTEFGLTRSTRKMLSLLATNLVQKQIDTDLPIPNASFFLPCSLTEARLPCVERSTIKALVKVINS